MSIRCSFALAGALVSTLGVASAHSAEPRGRTYAGTTSKGDPIVVQLSRDTRQVTRVLEMWDSSCTAGGTFPMKGSLRAKIRLSRSGTFRVRRQGTRPLGAQTVALDEVLTGKVRGGRLTGSIRATMTFRDQAAVVVDTCSTRFSFRAVAAQGRVFGGATSQGLPATIELTPDRSLVKDVHIGWRADCSNDTFTQVGDTLPNFTLTAGSFGDIFSEDQTLPEGATGHLAYNLDGRISGIRSTGTLSVQYTRSDATGAVTGTCDTGRLSWAASSG